MRVWLVAGLSLLYVLIDLSAVPVWRTPEALWAHAARVTSRSVRATGNHLRNLYVAGQDVTRR